MPDGAICQPGSSVLNARTLQRAGVVLFVLACVAAGFAQGHGAAGSGFTPGFAGGPRTGGGFTPSFAGGRPRMGGHPRTVTSHPGVTGTFRHRGEGRRSRFGTAFLGTPFWYDDGWYDDERYAPEPEARTVEAPVTRPEAPAPPPQPLLIERQGERFVRLTDAQVNRAVEPESPVGQRRERAVEATGNNRATAPAASDTPAVLVFRDGHRQEVASYSIIDGTLYESGSYYSSGYWNRKIQLAELDLPATLKVNQERGVKFVLPGGPNQVVTRP